MTRLIVISLVLGLALIVMLVWVSSGAGKSVEERNRLLDREGQAKAAARHDSIANKPRFPDIPRTEAFEALRIEWPEEDARRKAGGPIVLSARGNLVVFRRKSLTQNARVRHILPEVKRAALLERALALPAGVAAGPERFPITIKDGRSVVQRNAGPEDVAALIEAASGQVTPWGPPPFRLRLEEVASAPPPDGAKPWPASAGLPDPRSCVGEGAEVKGTAEERSRLLSVLEPGVVLHHGTANMVFKVIEFVFLLPSS